MHGVPRLAPAEYPRQLAAAAEHGAPLVILPRQRLGRIVRILLIGRRARFPDRVSVHGAILRQSAREGKEWRA